MSTQQKRDKEIPSQQELESQERSEERRQERERIARIKHKILVLSGSGMRKI